MHNVSTVVNGNKLVITIDISKDTIKRSAAVIDRPHEAGRFHCGGHADRECGRLADPRA